MSNVSGNPTDPVLPAMASGKIRMIMKSSSQKHNQQLIREITYLIDQWTKDKTDKYLEKIKNWWRANEDNVAGDRAFKLTITTIIGEHELTKEEAEYLYQFAPEECR